MAHRTIAMAAILAALGIAALVLIGLQNGDAPPPVHGAPSHRGPSSASATVPVNAEGPPAREDPVQVTRTETAAPFVIAGHLLGPDGRGLDKGRVTVWADAETMAREDLRGRLSEVRTKNGGTFRIELDAAGTYRLIARARGCSSSDVCFVQLTDASPTADVPLRLRDTGEVTGIVLSSDGEGVPGAVLSLITTPDRLARYAGIPAHARATDAVPTRSGSDGKFRFEAVDRRGTYWLRCGLPDQSEHAAECPGVRAGHHVPLHIDAVRSLRGVVVYAETGQAVPQFKVRAYAARSGPSIGPFASEINEATGRNGSVFITRVPRDQAMVVVVEAEGRAPASVTVPATTDDFRISLQPLGVIACRVRYADGTPARGVTVTASSWSPMPLQVDRRTATVDTQGGAVLEAVPGRCVVSATGPLVVDPGTVPGLWHFEPNVTRREVTVTPGAKAELEIVLPRRLITRSR